MTTERAATEQAGQYVTLGIDGEVFAVDVESVREILDMRPASKLPNAPAFLLGMIDVRGQAVPVIDLRVKLGLPPVPPTEHSRIVVLDAELGQHGHHRVMGLLADRVFEVTALCQQDLEPPPEVGIRWRSDYIRAIGRRDGGFVVVFNLRHLFSSEEAALLNPVG